MLFKKKKNVENTPEPRLYNVVSVYLDENSNIKQIYRNRSKRICMDFDGGISIDMCARTALEVRRLLDESCDDLLRYADAVKNEAFGNAPSADQFYSVSE